MSTNIIFYQLIRAQNITHCAQGLSEVITSVRMATLSVSSMAGRRYGKMFSSKYSLGDSVGRV